MKKSAYIVVGLGYGDEGKGSATNHLCRLSSDPLVIRFNGGHQAGHTVVHPDGKRHVFSSFGSGTLLSVPTYWSSYCTVSPHHLIAEYHSLEIIPKLFIDIRCPITTHYDVLYNRALESYRGAKRNGSCGVGFGATIERHFNEKVQFTFRDIQNSKKIKERLKVIRDYYRSKITHETDFDFNNFEHEQADEDFFNCLAELMDLKDRNVIEIVHESDIFSCKDWKTYIFEGAQGILLDQSFGCSPHITKSNTSSENAIKILNRNFPRVSYRPDINICYISRTYLTRHGAGPFSTSIAELDLVNNTFETNTYNEYQGNFRTGCLHIDLLNSALKWDNQFSDGFNKHIIFTCADHIPGPTLSVYQNHQVFRIKLDEIPALINQRFKTIQYSFDPCMNNVRLLSELKHV